MNPSEPIYGEQYLPRKFKIGISHPTDNSVDVRTNDIGLVPADSQGTRWDLWTGGGLGLTHNNPRTAALLGEHDFAAYCRRTGRSGVQRSDRDFYMAYNLFRIAAILQGIAKRVVDGTAASEYAREAGSRTRPLAELGWAQVERILKRAA